MHNPSECKLILELARRAIQTYLENGAIIESPDEAFLREPSGAFVTLKIDGDLRGCIGFTEPKFPLGETVIRCAIHAAVRDPRFPPLQPVELEMADIEVSILSEFREMANVEEIVIGAHGLYITAGVNRGLLLPQVASEYHWDRDTFMRQTCRKAGLPPDAWKTPGVKVEIFSAEVFGEGENEIADPV